jgi:hypothetical protein
MYSENAIRKSIRNWVIFFIVALVISGVTAFAMETELVWLDHLFKNGHSSLSLWINKVYLGLRDNPPGFYRGICPGDTILLAADRL